MNHAGMYFVWKGLCVDLWQHMVGEVRHLLVDALND